jgi:hypothetical protein
MQASIAIALFIVSIPAFLDSTPGMETPMGEVWLTPQKLNFGKPDALSPICSG